MTARPLEYINKGAPTQMVSVEMMCSAIDSEIERLLNQLNELTHRLDPILFPEPPEANEKEAGYGQANCRLGQVLYSELITISHANKMVANILSRILL